jgi:hypothetical protein
MIPTPRNTKFKATPRQKLATKLARGGVTDILFYGGSRSGKTFLICRLIVIRALRAPGSRHAIARKYFRDARQKIGMGTLVDVLKIMGLEYELNKTDWIFTLHNGSEVWICGLDSPEEAEKILGTEWPKRIS